MARAPWLPDRAGRDPVKYRAIAAALAADIAAGRLRPGDRLPPQRDLAWRLGVNVATVTEAYREAARQGLVGGEVGRGTYVRADPCGPELFGPRQATGIIDLAVNLPAIDPADRRFAETLAAMAAEGLGADTLGYAAGPALARGRLAAAAWAAERGWPVPADRVTLAAGAQAGLAAVLGLLTRPGDAVLAEALTFPGLLAAARQFGLRLVPVALDAEGVVPADLDRAARASGARVAVLTPCLQNPTGALMGPARQAEVAAVLARADLTLVEDDVYGPLTDMPPLSALVPDRAVLVSSLSKAVAPGLRFGFVAAPPRVIAGLAAEGHATTWQIAPVMLALAARWIGDGTAARRVRWQIREIAARQRLAATALGIAPGIGPHLWLAHADGDRLAAAALEQGVALSAASAFAVGRSGPDGVRLCLAAARDRRQLAKALDRLVTSAAGLS